MSGIGWPGIVRLVLCGLAVALPVAAHAQDRSAELWEMIGSPKTYVYVAGLEKMLQELDVVFAALAGSKQKWERRKAELMAGKRWVELVY